jgi:enamine deaminase RidA (YjgF/YER057c/UK114 family)
MSDIVRLGVTRRWSDAVVHRGTAYFVEVAEDLSADTRHQVLQIFSQVEQRLSLLGSDLTKLLQVIIFLPNPADFADFNELWDSWLPLGHAPSRACLHTALAAPELRVEFVITAAVPDSIGND